MKTMIIIILIVISIELCIRNAAAKLAFIILTFNVTFINKSHGDMKRRCII